MSFRPDINALRALAVCCVVLFHLGVPGFGGGYVGVDVFFVISGFLMTQWITARLDAGTFSFLEFYAARARRIVPALAVLCGVLLAAGALLFLPSIYRELGRSSVAAIGFISNLFFWHEAGYFDTSSQDKLLLHTWSLSLEWQFYLLLPVVLWALRRWWSPVGALRGVVGALLLSLVISVVGTHYKPVSAFFLLPPRAFELLLGGVVCLAPHWLRLRWGASLGLLLIAGSVAFFTERLPFPGYLALVPVLGAALVVAGARPRGWFEHPMVQRLGEVSYSFYLWHWPLIVIARWNLPELTLPIQAALFVAALAAAELSYRFVERPLRRARDGATPGGFLARAGVVCALLAAVSGTIAAANGFPSRVPPLSARIDDVANEAPYRRYCDASKPCAIGAPKPERVVIWGDSHAGHLRPALASIVEQDRNLRYQPVIALHFGCPPIRGVNGPNDARCVRQTNRSFELTQAPDVAGVVIAARWEWYFYGDLHRPVPPLMCRVHGNGCESFEDAAAAFAYSQRQLISDVTKLIGLGKRVHLLGPLPVHAYSVSRYLAQRAWYGTPPSPQLTTARHRELNADIERFLAAVAAATGATLLDPADQFCPGPVCRLEQDRRSLFTDHNHLAPAGAMLLSPVLVKLLR